jgi:DNA-binding NarL/FixJ family response regulator
MHDESLHADRVLRAGARGYITKHEGGEKLMRSIRHVLGGKIYVSERISAHILEIFSGGQLRLSVLRSSSLAIANSRCLSLSAKLSARAIARRLHLSPKTVDAHRANIKEKLNIKASSELISYAARWTAYRASGE